MKQEKSYEERIADIKKYLKEKEEDVANNRASEEKRESIRQKKISDSLVFDDDNDEDNSDLEIEENPYQKIVKSSEKNRIDEEKKLEDIEIDNEMLKKSNNSVDNTVKKEMNILNKVLIILLLIAPIFVTLSVIGYHSSYLIKEPMKYILYALSGISIIGIICSLILKCLNENISKKIVNIVMIIILGIMDVIFLYLFIKKKFWTKLDPILEHKKLFVLLFGLLLVGVIALFIVFKVKHIRLKSKIKSFLVTLFLTVYILGCVDFSIILYGKHFAEFKEWLITTAMQTMHHQYFCKWFYNEQDIDYVLSQNYVQESGESTNPDLINTEKEEVVVYENEYEEAVLKKEHKDDIYTIIELEVNGCKGYLAVIYDPTTVHVAVTNRVGSYGQYVTGMAKDNGAVLAINGGGFYDPGNTSTGGFPTGITISKGEIITNGEYGWNVQTGGIIGFDTKGVLYLLKNTTAQEAIDMGITDAVSWGPFLIVNGEPSFIKGNGGWGYAARTAIGQRADGIVLLLTIDSNATRTKGADMVDLTEIMQTYGAINAANLDGGTSTVMVMPREQALKYNSSCEDDYCTINDPIDGALRHQTRAIADSFVVIPN